MRSSKATPQTGEDATHSDLQRVHECVAGYEERLIRGHGSRSGARTEARTEAMGTGTEG